MKENAKTLTAWLAVQRERRLRLYRFIFPYRVLTWVRHGIPKKQASFQHVMDSIQFQAISASFLIVIFPFYRWVDSLPFFLERLFYQLLGFVYAIGAVALVGASIYRTIYAFDEATFLNQSKRGIPLSGGKRWIVIAWSLSISIASLLAWLAVLLQLK